MNQHCQPAIDSRYVTQFGESFVVISMGTGGVVVEYIDGRVELISLQQWSHLGPVAERLAH